MNCDVPALWQEHKEALYFFILKRVKDDGTTKDIAQEVMIKVYNFCLSKSGVQNVRSWLFQIASNAIVDHFRKHRRNVYVDNFHEAAEEEEASAFRDAAEFILPMIGLLPQMYAQPLRMSDVEGIKLKDIATALNLGLNAVKQRVSRGRKMLKDVFTECCLLELDDQGRLVSFEIRPDCGALQRYKKTLENIS
jgi:RNA polymerase sigma-70 factor (ECF subfamily)